MSATRGLRVAVVGATGAVGSEVLHALDASPLAVGEIVAVAGESSLGTDIEFQGEVSPVHGELPALQGLDALICCAPREAAGEVVRAALRAEVFCVEVSGAFAGRDEVPVAWPGVPVPDGAPLVTLPPATALVWAALFEPMAAEGRLLRVDGTVLEAASAAGRRGIEALSAESLALFNQQDAPEPDVGRPLAFDCHPAGEDFAVEGPGRERELRAALTRRFDPAPALTARWIRVPVFVGEASSLALEFERELDPERAAECLAKAAGVELWDGGAPNLRAAAGRDCVIAGRPEADAEHARRLHLWVVADVLRLAAQAAVAALSARWPRP